MRIVSWNCQGSLKSSEKIKFIESLKPDVLIAQEVRESDINECEIKIWLTNNPDKKNPKGLGIYSFNKELKIKPLEKNSDYEIYQPINLSYKDFNFNIMAVWSYNKRSVGKFKGKSGLVLRALNDFDRYLTKNDMWIGDFNNGPEIKNGKSWLEVEDVFSKKSFGKSNFDGHYTHFHNSGRSFQIDHCFLGNDLQSKFKAHPLLDIKDVPSDHLPLIIDAA